MAGGGGGLARWTIYIYIFAIASRMYSTVGGTPNQSIRFTCHVPIRWISTGVANITFTVCCKVVLLQLQEPDMLKSRGLQHAGLFQARPCFLIIREPDGSNSGRLWKEWTLSFGYFNGLFEFRHFHGWFDGKTIGNVQKGGGVPLDHKGQGIILYVCMCDGNLLNVFVKRHHGLVAHGSPKLYHHSA